MNNKETEMQKSFADYPLTLDQDIGEAPLTLHASGEEVDVMETIKRAMSLLESTNNAVTKARNEAFKPTTGPKIIIQQQYDCTWYAYDEHTADGDIESDMCSGISSVKLYAILDLIEQLFQSEVYTEKELMSVFNVG